MTEKERRLAAAMLDDYSDRLSNAGCNDWEFPEDWSEAERQAFVREYEEFNGTPEEYDRKRSQQGISSLGDFCVASLLAHKLDPKGSGG